MTASTPSIDPHRPWIRDERDDPAQMNWVQTLFNPMGETTKLHFSRAWTVMFMGRVILFIGPVFAAFLAGLAGADTSGAWKPVKFLVLPISALLVPFFLFALVTEYTSFVAHVRRFAEARRSTLKAVIVLIPLMLGMLGFMGGAMMGVGQAKHAEAVAAARATLAENPDDAEAKKIVEAADKQAKNANARGQGGGQRGGPGGQAGGPPDPKAAAIGAGFGMGLGLWLLASFGVMLWTLLHVARLPNGGEGPFRTGSDLGLGVPD